MEVYLSRFLELLSTFLKVENFKTTSKKNFRQAWLGEFWAVFFENLGQFALGSPTPNYGVLVPPVPWRLTPNVCICRWRCCNELSAKTDRVDFYCEGYDKRHYAFCMMGSVSFHWNGDPPPPRGGMLALEHFRFSLRHGQPSQQLFSSCLV